ncbi:MAG: hypothetical protein OZSIB_2302 [Candidatus Ozemobacter sibiricus]|uniref:Radical SAM core domain-containing protein n=1 Tax=Candidatus Ozemobacter sibiricus TaxID=2268124 RepID=A0A367ZTG1_9BACT|nr:MAG: hypothetical protein OZSIB_2302 [Candidatus Ozemobacter sibiricus]
MTIAMSPAPRLLLVHPPVVRPCEPPAGLARLAGTLRAAGRQVEVWDANLEALLALLQAPSLATDTWTRRAGRDRDHHLAALRDGRLFAHPDTYRRAIGDLERWLARLPCATAPFPDGGWHLSLTDCTHDQWEPTSSHDLQRLAADPLAHPAVAVLQPALRNRLLEREITHLGLSVNYLSQALAAAALAGLARQLRPDLRIILGGGLITSWLARGTRPPAGLAALADHLLTGPGEAGLLALLAAPPAPASVPLASASQPPRPDVAQPRPAPTSADGLPQAARPAPPEPSPPAPAPVDDPTTWAYDFSDFPLDQYLSPGLVLPFSLAHGCFYARCAFCPETFERQRYRPLPTALVGERLAALVNRYRPRLLHFLDDAIHPAVLQELAAHPPGVPWYGFARFAPPLDDPDFCRLLARAGCRMLQLGLESGDQAVLDELRKGLRLATAARILAHLHAAGIGTYVYLLFGTPAEDEEAARRTRDFVAAHAERISFLNVAIFNLPRQAPEAATLPTRPYTAGDLGLYLEFAHPRGWNRPQVRRFLEREFRRHPAIAPILRRDPPAFTSSHAPFFLVPPPRR